MGPTFEGLKEKLGVRNIIHPGVPELIQFLDSIPNIRMSFFSSGISERNEIFVTELLRLSLGQERYESIQDKITVCSRNDLEKADNSFSIAQREYYGFCSGNNTKNLNKISRDNETLDWAILIDDDVSYAKHGQEKNLLKIPMAWVLTFSSFFQNQRSEEDFFRGHMFFQTTYVL